jgi:hypothetical protein
LVWSFKSEFWPHPGVTRITFKLHSDVARSRLPFSSETSFRSKQRRAPDHGQNYFSSIKKQFWLNLGRGPDHDQNYFFSKNSSFDWI